MIGLATGQRKNVFGKTLTDQRRPGRGVQRTGGEETGRLAATVAVVVERFESAIKKKIWLRD